MESERSKNMNNKPMLFANAHMMLIYELQSARNRLCLLGILHTDDEIDAIADAAVAEIEEFRRVLKITVPELQAPTPDTIEMLLRREPTKSQVWSPSALLACYARRHYPPPFHFESATEGKHV